MVLNFQTSHCAKQNAHDYTGLPMLEYSPISELNKMGSSLVFYDMQKRGSNFRVKEALILGKIGKI